MKDAGIPKTHEFLLRVEIAIEVFVLLFARLPYPEVEPAGGRRTEQHPVDELSLEPRLQQAT